jgi:hypothetical protein
MAEQQLQLPQPQLVVRQVLMLLQHHPVVQLVLSPRLLPLVQSLH